jgi:hypothetical protein
MDLGARIMIRLTTKTAADLVSQELQNRARNLALAVLCNESTTMELEVATDEVEDFERAAHVVIDSDIVPDPTFKLLVDYLRDEGLLEKSSEATLSA